MGFAAAPADEPSMDIASLASSIAQIQTSNSISVAVAKKSLDAQKQEGDAAIKLLEQAAKTAPGSSGDARPDGVGAGIDVRG